MARFFKHCSARMMGLLVGHGGLLLGLCCDDRDYRLHHEGLKGGGFELPADNAECSVLAAFQLVGASQGCYPGAVKLIFLS